MTKKIGIKREKEDEEKYEDKVPACFIKKKYFQLIFAMQNLSELLDLYTSNVREPVELLKISLKELCIMHLLLMQISSVCIALN